MPADNKDSISFNDVNIPIITPKQFDRCDNVWQAAEAFGAYRDDEANIMEYADKQA